MTDRALLEWLETELAAGSERDLWPPLAFVAGRDLEIGEHELHAALRRALLLVAAGGDPRRTLDLDERAVTALASELEEPQRRSALVDRLLALSTEVEGLPIVADALHAMVSAPDRAWRAYACSLLAAELSE